MMNKNSEYPTNLRRRTLLKFGLLAPAIHLAGCSEQEQSNTSNENANFLAPKKIQCARMDSIDVGTNYRNDAPMRSDIRHHKDGVFTHINFQVVDVNKKCRPLAYANIEVWHADTRGRYSDIDELTGMSNNGSRYCRGYQSTTRFGKAQFITDIPAWSLEHLNGQLASRVSHLNIRVSLENKTVLTTECFFPDDVIERVYGFEPYRQLTRKSVVNKAGNKTVFERPASMQKDPNWQSSLQSQNVFSMQPITQGYRADLVIGVSL